MIDLQSFDFAQLPFVSLAQRSRLPTTPGIYFAVNDLGEVQYIGKSVNLAARWVGHHHYSQLAVMRGVRIFYMQIEIDKLLSIEAALIKQFNPPLNGRNKEPRCRTRPMKRLSVSVPGCLYKRLEKMADFEGRSISNLTSYLLEHSVELEKQGFYLSK